MIDMNAPGHPDPKVLFICTGNAGRSQMAEAMFRARYGDRFEVFSAGVEPWADLHPMAVRLMTEDGLSLAGQHPKHVKTFVNAPIDMAVTIGDRAEAETPDLPTRTRRVHWPIPDPAEADGTPDSEAVFRHTRAAILQRLPRLLAEMAPALRCPPAPLQPAVSTCLFRSPSLLDTRGGAPAFRPARDLPLLTAAGFRQIELCCYVATDFPWRDPAAIRDLRDVADDLNVGVYSLHTPELELGGGQPRDIDGAAKTLEAFVSMATELGAAVVVFHLFPTRWDGAEDALEAFIGELETIVAHTPVTFCLETLQDPAANETVESILRKTLRSAFGFVVDTGHAHVASDLPRTPQRLEGRLKSLHIHDNDGQSDQHRPIGKGTIDWQRFADDLAEARYQGPLMLESGGPGHVDKLPEFLRTSYAALESMGSRIRTLN